MTSDGSGSSKASIALAQLRSSPRARTLYLKALDALSTKLHRLKRGHPSGTCEEFFESFVQFGVTLYDSYAEEHLKSKPSFELFDHALQDDLKTIVLNQIAPYGETPRTLQDAIQADERGELPGEWKVRMGESWRLFHHPRHEEVHRQAVQRFINVFDNEPQKWPQLVERIHKAISKRVVHWLAAHAERAELSANAMPVDADRNRPVRHEIEKFANDAFALARDRILREYAEKENRVLGQVELTRNSGGYLPALVKLEADGVRDTVLAQADAYVEAFTLYGVPSDAQAEKALQMSAQQMTGGSISAVRGQLRLRSGRLRIAEEGQGMPWHLEIEKSMDAALKEGLLRLRRQRIQFRNSGRSLQQELPPAKTAASTLGASGGDSGRLEKLGRSTPPEDVKKKRGRPQTILDEKKTAAMLLKESGGTNKQMAALIYGTKYPTPQQTKNVPAILRHHKLKLKQSSSLAKRRKASPPPRKTGG